MEIVAACKAQVGSVCWFTGMTLPNDAVTIEHLTPQTLFKQKRQANFEANLVATFNEMNGTIGCAPLSVKFALREYLQSGNFIVPHWMPEATVRKTYASIARTFLQQYRVTFSTGSKRKTFERYPWQAKDIPAKLKADQKKQWRAFFQRKLFELMSEEEIALYRLKNS